MTTIRSGYDPLLPTLLISIHKEYVDEINAGTKVIEYRKSFFKDQFQAFIYASGKNGGISTFIRCNQPIISDADHLARIGSIVGNDDYHEIFDYFQAKNTGVIIPIRSASQIHKLDLPTLRKQFGNFNAPQKYTFLDKPEKQSLLNYLIDQELVRTMTNDWNHFYAQIANKIN
ncbi:hypothetical protein M3M38_04595 [Fructilactobacillus cliffordii]|uniref:hypothetical protein n=1 Tax=Fructilactobacillus cliffordii TaxID=2940299 RepID=UPI002093147C|nr:hypothetical protein [Fructilactobacillus cliffordii]USS85988.1 hypothetical protein M3M38_04595 [Fructilactobacillus cliffordii]